MVAVKNGRGKRRGRLPDIGSGPDGIERMVFQTLMRRHLGQTGPGHPTANDLALPPWGANGRLGGRFGNPMKLDIPGECGYPTDDEMDVTWYKSEYDRNGIAARVVNIYPDECWAVHPDIYETDDNRVTTFETAWDALIKRTLAFHYIHRVDRLSRVAQFAILYLGFDDGAKPDKAPAGINPKTGDGTPTKQLNLMFVRCFDQSTVRVEEVDRDINSPRYGLPVTYLIQFQNPAVSGKDPGKGNPPVQTSIQNRVHWTRVIHVADNIETNEYLGIPILRRVANYLWDIKKVAGGSGEMFWRGGFPGFSFETYPDLAGDSAVDVDSLRDEMWAYQRGLQRYLATVGGKWNSLQPQVANPDKHLEWYIQLICASIGVPMRIFMGSESGHLASTEDASAWKGRLLGRQINYLEPRLMRPFVDRLLQFGCLPKPKNGIYICNWRDLKTLSDLEKADIALKKSQALGQFTSMNVGQEFPRRLYLTMILGMTEDQVNSIEEELKKNPPNPPLEMQLADKQQETAIKTAAMKPAPVAAGVKSKTKKTGPSGGARKGNPPRKNVGKPKNSPPEGKVR